ncbi:MAG: hypothetical protein ACI8XB_001769 [Patiriisocius sp.]|jgi:hypothetical protein
MRILAFILSLVVLSISLVPCTDGLEAHSHEENIANLEHGHDHEHNDHDHSEESGDDCPPFCSCTCCGVSITIPTNEIWSIKNNSNLFSYSFHYSSLYTYAFSEGLWHPPSQA